MSLNAGCLNPVDTKSPSHSGYLASSLCVRIRSRSTPPVVRLAIAIPTAVRHACLLIIGVFAVWWATTVALKIDVGSAPSLTFCLSHCRVQKMCNYELYLVIDYRGYRGGMEGLSLA